MKNWEDICSNCGLCCHEKVVLPDMLIIDDEKSCEFYSEETHRCTVYPNRFKECSRCMRVNLFRAMFSPALPNVCAYVRMAEKYHIRFAHKRETVIASLD